jgi:Na+/phosphate symporter
MRRREKKEKQSIVQKKRSHFNVEKISRIEKRERKRKVPNCMMVTSPLILDQVTTT